jgi:hypothetical protein
MRGSFVRPALVATLAAGCGSAAGSGVSHPAPEGGTSDASIEGGPGEGGPIDTGGSRRRRSGRGLGCRGRVLLGRRGRRSRCGPLRQPDLRKQSSLRALGFVRRPRAHPELHQPAALLCRRTGRMRRRVNLHVLRRRRVRDCWSVRIGEPAQRHLRQRVKLPSTRPGPRRGMGPSRAPIYGVSSARSTRGDFQLPAVEKMPEKNLDPPTPRDVDPDFWTFRGTHGVRMLDAPRLPRGRRARGY